MGLTKGKETQSSDVSPSVSHEHISSSCQADPFYRRMIDSFKPSDLEKYEIDMSNMTQVEKSNYATSRQPLARKLKERHLQMIGIGGSIGTGLFISSGRVLSQGGPAGQLMSYFIVGYSVYCVMNALGEMSVQYPVSGSFHAYFTRFIDPSWGFACGLLYSFGMVILLPLELIACSLCIGYWNSSINPVVWVAIFYVLICVINLFGVKGFGEVEFVLAYIKVIAVVGFLILGICLICGAGNGGYIGGKYWHNPGPFNHGFKGVVSSFVSAGFSFGGIEIMALAAAETANPRKSIPCAVKQVVWRIIIFYLLTTVIIGCLVPYNNKYLLTGKSSTDIAQSPFVIAIRNGGIRVLPDIMNAVILVSVVSVGNASFYGSSRSLSSLAVQGMLPKCVGYVDRAGRPLVAILISSIFGLLSFLVADPKHQGDVFSWLLAISGLIGFLVWISVCFAHVRFRWALNRQDRSLDEIIFPSPTGVWGSVSGMLIVFLMIIGQIWTTIWPVGSPRASAKSFFISCLSLPLVFVLWAGHKIYTRSWNQFLVNTQEVDLDAGRRELDIDELKKDLSEERNYIRSRPFWYRVYKVWC